MNLETYWALKGSVVKWIKIYRGRGVEKGAGNCPLCGLYNLGTNIESAGCWGCPVSERTGQHFCHETPHQKWVDHNETHNRSHKVECPKCAVIALEEIDFLLSLMPEEIPAMEIVDITTPVSLCTR